uniref:Uncharacterized protein n=1 Tax=Anthurium amnicola TaxID=1678845 RepID=A0A1D1YWS8_9ARAE
MLPEQWSSPCRNLCTKKYAALVQIPCVIDCNEICYKDPVLKEYQWTAYIDRSPGPENYSRECFHACVSGCSYKFHMPTEKAEQVQPKRRLKPAMERKSSPTPPVDPMLISDDMPSTSA